MCTSYGARSFIFLPALNIPSFMFRYLPIYTTQVNDRRITFEGRNSLVSIIQIRPGFPPVYYCGRTINAMVEAISMVVDGPSAVRRTTSTSEGTHHYSLLSTPFFPLSPGHNPPSRIVYSPKPLQELPWMRRGRSWTNDIQPLCRLNPLCRHQRSGRDRRTAAAITLCRQGQPVVLRKKKNPRKPTKVISAAVSPVPTHFQPIYIIVRARKHVRTTAPLAIVKPRNDSIGRDACSSTHPTWTLISRGTDNTNITSLGSTRSLER